MIKRNQSTGTDNDSNNDKASIEIDREFSLNQALSFSAILNDIMFDTIHEAPKTEHEKDVREGMIFLSWHIEDLLREYLKPDDSMEVRP